MLESQEAAKLAEIERQLQASAQKGQEIANGSGMTEADRLARSQQREQEAMEELNRALAQARLQGQQVVDNASANDADENSNNQPSGKAEGNITVNERAVKAISDDDEAQEVVKKVKVTSDYFNTLTENDPEPNLIKAIIDENVKAVDGSRVRLRLLDDIEINEIVVWLTR